MSDYYEARVTVTADGEERDVFVRGFVTVEPGLGMGGAMGAELDGDPEVMISGTWCPIESVDLDDGDEDRIEEALCDKALEDEGLDADEYEAAE